jgi:hypothetical protein
METLLLQLKHSPKFEIFDSDGEFDQVSFMALSIQKRKVK